jgi:16S rRNA (cytosine967-C5)-methyltransferase
MSARLLGPGAGRSVLDLCAAPGGKTMQLAAAGFDVTAVDSSATRLERLRANLERTGLAADVVQADLMRWSPAAPPDAILLGRAVHRHRHLPPPPRRAAPGAAPRHN